jgi:hypothetical protein
MVNNLILNILNNDSFKTKYLIMKTFTPLFFKKMHSLSIAWTFEVKNMNLIN